MNPKSVAEQIEGRNLALEQVDALIAQRDALGAALRTTRRSLRAFGRGTNTAVDRLIEHNIDRINRALGESE